MVRQKILRCAGDSHLPTEQVLVRIRAGGKVSSLSKETFPQWEVVQVKQQYQELFATEQEKKPKHSRVNPKHSFLP